MEEITPRKLLHNSFFLTHFLSIKYGSPDENYDVMLIDSLVFSLPSHYLSNYKEMVLLNDNEEFLKRKYTKQESLFKMPKLASYYKNYQEFFGHPLFRNLTFGFIMQNYGDYKAECFYKDTYGNKHVKRVHNNTNNKDHNISLQNSSNSHGRDYIEENKTIFDLLSRKTIENQGVTSIELIPNQSKLQNYLVLSNYNNENLFYSKRNNIDDSLIYLVDYMNTRKRTDLANNINKNNMINKKTNVKQFSKTGKRSSAVNGEKTKKAISAEKETSSFISNMCQNNKKIKVSNSLTIRSPKKLTRFVSPKYSINNSNIIQPNSQATFSPQFTEQSKSGLKPKNGKYKSKSSKYSFSCPNVISIEKNVTRNSRKNTMPTTKNSMSEKERGLKSNTPLQKKSSGLYKKSVNKPVNKASKQINFFNYLNNCMMRSGCPSQTMTEFVISERFQTNNKSLLTQSNIKRKKNSVVSTKITFYTNKNSTRNYENALIKTLPTNHTIDNQTTSTIKKEITPNTKINVNLIMNTESNLKSSILSTKPNINTNHNKSKTKSNLRNKGKPKISTKLNLGSKIITCDTGVLKQSNTKKTLTYIRDLKNELKGKSKQQINQKTFHHIKTKSCIGLSSINTISNNSEHNTILDINNTEDLKQMRNNRIVVNRMRNFKSFNQHTFTIMNANSSNVNSILSKGIKDQEDSPWSKSGISNGYKVMFTAQNRSPVPE